LLATLPVDYQGRIVRCFSVLSRIYVTIDQKLPIVLSAAQQ